MRQLQRLAFRQYAQNRVQIRTPAGEEMSEGSRPRHPALKLTLMYGKTYQPSLCASNIRGMVNNKIMRSRAMDHFRAYSTSNATR